MSTYKTDKIIEGLPIEVVSKNNVTHTMEIINQPSGDGIEWGYVKDGDGVFIPFTIQTPGQEYYDRKVNVAYGYETFATIPTSQSSSYKISVIPSKGRHLVCQVTSSSLKDKLAPAPNFNITNVISVPSGVTYTQISNTRNSSVYPNKNTWAATEKRANASCVTTWEINVPNDSSHLDFYFYATRSPGETNRGAITAIYLVKLEDFD